MKVLADHCVPEGILNVLRAADIDVLRVVDLVDPRTADRDVAALAARNGAILLTSDADFLNRKDFAPRRTGGIILLRDLDIARERVLRRLLRLLSGNQASLSGTVTVLDRRSARVRHA